MEKTSANLREHFFGLDNLDERLLEYVSRRRGTFVELGAFDGLKQSNTAWLEANRGWRGILIEPIPEAFERCVENRPLATVVNCACVSSQYREPTAEMVYAGLMSIVRGARATADAEEEWVARGEELQELKRYTCTVPARTLTSILEEHGQRHIDLLSLDVEGYELEVLNGLDLDRFQPHHILVEESGEDDVGTHLTSRGWERVIELASGERTSDVLYRRCLHFSRRILSRLPRRISAAHLAVRSALAGLERRRDAAVNTPLEAGLAALPESGGARDWRRLPLHPTGRAARSAQWHSRGREKPSATASTNCAEVKGEPR